MLDLSKYEQMTADECWDRYGWGIDAEENSIVYHRIMGEREIFVDKLRGGYFCCEIYEPTTADDVWLADSDEMTGQWTEDTIEDAIRGAVVDSVTTDVLRIEKNCEDAVNAIAYKAYSIIFGVPKSLESVDLDELDKLLKFAREQVKAHGRFFGVPWEEF